MITLILGVFHHFCKSARSASRQRKNFMESLHSDGSATNLLIIWVEKIIPLGMKSKQKSYHSIVFLSILLLYVYKISFLEIVDTLLKYELLHFLSVCAKCSREPHNTVQIAK